MLNEAIFLLHKIAFQYHTRTTDKNDWKILIAHLYSSVSWHTLFEGSTCKDSMRRSLVNYCYEAWPRTCPGHRLDFGWCLLVPRPLPHISCIQAWALSISLTWRMNMCAKISTMLVTAIIICIQYLYKKPAPKSASTAYSSIGTWHVRWSKLRGCGLLSGNMGYFASLLTEK